MDCSALCLEPARFEGHGLLLLVDAAGALPAPLSEALAPHLAAAPTKAGSVTVLPTFGRLPVAWVAIAGLGERRKLTPDSVRRAVAAGVRQLGEQGCTRLGVDLSGLDGVPVRAAGAAVAEGALLALYQFGQFKREPAPLPVVSELVLLVDGDEAAWQGFLAEGAAKAAGTALARDLVNLPANHLKPLDLAERARALAAAEGLACRVLDSAELALLGANLLLAVNQGSVEPAVMVVLEYRGGGADETPLGLVGKGVCFDSGGLSLKTADGMMSMKGDMGGAAAVLGTLLALARLRVPRNVTGVLPIVQNLVGPSSLRPGDVVRSLSGQTVEVLNTDAEGRLILADALSYATATLGLSPVIDIATLTGACARALRPAFAGVLGTAAAVVQNLQAAGAEAGERLWELPLDEVYGELLESAVADLRNIGGAEGGASSAAMFLRAFVGETPWAHVDMAGWGLTDTPGPYQPKGATGFGVRTLVNYCLAG